MLKKKTGIKPKSSQLSPQEKYWNQADSKARQLITEVFEHPVKEEAYTECLQSYQRQEEIPDSSEELASELAYEYLLGVCQSILEQLSQFSCHDFAYFEQLIQPNE